MILVWELVARPLAVVVLDLKLRFDFVRLLSPFDLRGTLIMFAPVVLLVAKVLGRRELNQLRGKAIAAHSKVITQVCNWFGIDSKARQAMIRTARDNGKKLGLLA
jgi:hypothetical protein